MIDYLKTLFKPKAPKSADIARERLKIILHHERRSIDSPLLEQLKEELREEIIKVVRKFVEVDKNNIEINLKKEENAEILDVTVPIPNNALNAR
jgi:cell division topological specificity factor